MSKIIVVTATDLLVGALTIHGEGRGLKQHGRDAIAHAILNRCRARAWYGIGVRGHVDHSIAAVCLKAQQFSCWNDSDPNAKLLRTLRTEYQAALSDRSCRASLKALIDALDGFTLDATGGATHYLTAALHKTAKAPAWSRGKTFIEIEGHRFFAGIK